MSADEITVYWRPGCPYCLSLRAGLRRSRTPYRAVNIWSDPDAAAFVRTVANGNETVTTEEGQLENTQVNRPMPAELAAPDTKPGLPSRDERVADVTPAEGTPTTTPLGESTTTIAVPPATVPAGNGNLPPLRPVATVPGG